MQICSRFFAGVFTTPTSSLPVLPHHYCTRSMYTAHSVVVRNGYGAINKLNVRAGHPCNKTLYSFCRLGKLLQWSLTLYVFQLGSELHNHSGFEKLIPPIQPCFCSARFLSLFYFIFLNLFSCKFCICWLFVHLLCSL